MGGPVLLYLAAAEVRCPLLLLLPLLLQSLLLYQ
jgi:hypothetical protein